MLLKLQWINLMLNLHWGMGRKATSSVRSWKSLTKKTFFLLGIVFYDGCVKWINIEQWLHLLKNKVLLCQWDELHSLYAIVSRSPVWILLGTITRIERMIRNVSLVHRTHSIPHHQAHFILFLTEAFLCRRTLIRVGFITEVLWSQTWL